MDFQPICSGSRPKPRLSVIERAAKVLAFGAALALALPALGQVHPLSPEKAFLFSAKAVDAQTVEARFTIADGYYLYRDKMRFALDPGMTDIAVTLPPGKVKEDQFFGKVETYRGEVVVRVPLAQAPGKSVVLVADSQGCADAGVCYPATRQKVTLALPEAGKGPGPLVDAYPRKKNWFN